MINLRDAAKWYREQPHQLAAWDWLQNALDKEKLQEFEDLYRSAPPAKEPLPPVWLSASLKLIKEFEGCRLKAYLCPAGVATIGWGTTKYQYAPVLLGDEISQEMADGLLQHDIETVFGPGVLHLIPSARSWRPEQVAAIVSFAYNIGLGALETSTLRKRLNAGEPPCSAVRQELQKWVHAGEAVLPGLQRRRNAEIALFCAGQGNPLKVPYYSQRDSQIEGQANRMCFSSSCAMLVAALKPNALSGINADDQYLKTVLKYGDSTDYMAQLKALSDYGIKASFSQKCGWADIESQINRGIPVPCGFLHHGSSNAPSGGGHWLTVIGYTPTAVIVNDPWGEMLVAEGTYLGTRGAGLAYTRKNWGPRWMVEGPNTGWAVMASL